MSSLFSIDGARPFYLAIFTNAFVDLGHKITVQNTVFKIHGGADQVVLIATVNALILLPYILFFVPIANLADRYSKPLIMRRAAWVSVLLCALIAGCYSLGWFWAAFAMTLLMAIQSAVYSPAKLAFIKPLVGEAQLTRGNGWAQTAVIAGILLGTLFFSLGFEYLYRNSLLNKNAVMEAVSPLGIGLLFFALLQLWLVYRIPERESQYQSGGDTAGPNKHRSGSELPASSAKFSPAWKKIFSQRIFLLPVSGLALFWSVGQGMLAAFPSFAKSEAGIDNAAIIQMVLAASALGIAAGALLAGRLSRGGINMNLIPFGVAGLCTGLWLLGLWPSGHGGWHQDYAAVLFALLYFSMGVSSALFIVPLNAYIQWQAVEGDIGGIIAGSNVLQNIAMLMMLGCTIAFALLAYEGGLLLQGIALLATLAGAAIALLIRTLPDPQ